MSDQPALLDALPVVVYVAGPGPDGALRYVSPRAQALLGFAPERWYEGARSLWLERLHPDDRDDVLRERADARPGEPLRCEYRLIARDGRAVWVRDESIVVDGADGTAERHGVLLELGDERLGESPPRVAFRDEVTGLPDRSLLHEHLTVALIRAREHGREVALMHLGLDDFRLVNDGLGRDAGDELLRLAGERLRAITPPTNLVARPGGDEFCVMLADLDASAPSVAEIAAGQIAAALEPPFSVAGRDVVLRATVGASIFPRDARDAESLLKHAETAMYEAKASVRGGLAFYAGGTVEALEQLMMTGRLRRALEREEFELHYQPILDLRDGTVAAAEALLRWRDPERGMIAPLDFIPLAEYTGLIEPIGAWVIGEVCRQSRAWRDAGTAIRLSFNVSPRQFDGAYFADVLADGLNDRDLDPAAFVVEITESTAMRGADEVLRTLASLGVQVAIDDFGTGYSSLSRLRDLPVGMVKIDRDFLRRTPDDARAARVAAATIDLVGALGMSAVAEGVETETQRRFLVDRGCPLAQGFHLGRPVPADVLSGVLRGERRSARLH